MNLQQKLPLLPWLGLALLVIVLDQFTKQLALAWLLPYQPVSVMPSFNFTLAFNYGAAFSLLAQQSGWQRWLFMGLALIAAVVFVAWLRRLTTTQRRLALALSLMLGGALGNAIDRLILGYVIDFIDLYYGGWHWPAFNLADAALCVGAGLLLLDQSLAPPPSPPNSHERAN